MENEFTDDDDDWTQDLNIGLLEAESATYNSLSGVKRNASEHGSNGEPVRKLARHVERGEGSDLEIELVRVSS